MRVSAMTLPLRVKVDRMQSAHRIRSPGHCKWVREHGCSVPKCSHVPIEAAHVRTGTEGGTGIKPGDNWVISLCVHHHLMQHQHGEREFEQLFSIDMKALAMEFAAKSPFRNKFRRSA